jgi:hypothetical protein
MTTQDELTQALRGFTVLRSMEFSVDLDTGVCTLVLDLTESESTGAKAILAEFLGVSNLLVRNFGGGLTQLLLLAVEDISDRQLDRINYEVKELERESISFFCRTLTITRTSERD